MSALDRDAAREVLLKATYWDLYPDRVLDALEACVRPVPAQTIDPDALLVVVQDALQLRTAECNRLIHRDGDALMADTYSLFNAVQALLRPVEGIVLTPQEAEQAVAWFYAASTYAPPAEVHPRSRTLAKRLEAAS